MQKKRANKRSVLVFLCLLFVSACGSVPRGSVNTSREVPVDSVFSDQQEFEDDNPSFASNSKRMDGVEFFISKNLKSADNESDRPIPKNFPELRSVFEAPARSWRPQKGYNIPIVKNDRVEKWIRFFTGPIRSNFSRWLTRASLYAPTMEEIMREYRLPSDLIYLSMVESGFNLNAYSHAHAAGPWQFIRGTGRLYGLESGGIVDERRDLLKSTRAAAAHLRDLHRLYGDWYLAFAAYNAGSGAVNRAIRRSGTRDFWKMTNGRSRFLRQETKDYVPRILAAAIVTKDYKRYGFSSALFDKPLGYDVIEVPDSTDVEVIAKCARVNPQEVQSLNPSLMVGITPPGKSYSVLLPAGTAEKFRKNYARIPKSERVNYAFHRVKKRETWASIANHYKIPKSRLASVNRTNLGRRLVPGSFLAIPKKGATSIDKFLEPEPANFDVENLAERSPDENNLAALDTFQATTRKNNGSRGEPVLEQDLFEEARPDVEVRDTEPSHPETTPVADSDVSEVNTASALIPVRTAVAAVEKSVESRPQIHRVRRGETLGLVARRYGVSVAVLKSLNRIGSRNIIKTGQILKIPQTGGMGQSVARLSAAQQPPATVPKPALQPRSQSRVATTSAMPQGGRMIIHRVQRGETLWHLAQRYGVTIGMLKKWNGLAGNQLYPQQKIKIFATVKASAKKIASAAH